MTKDSYIEKFHNYIESNEKVLYTLFLLFFTIFSIWNRAYFIVDYSLWSDELFTVIAANQANIKDFFGIYINETNPPLHGLILFFWFKLFGNSELSARLPSLLFGIMTIFYLGYKSLSKKNILSYPYLITTGLFSVSFGSIFFSIEARPYSLLILITTILTVQFFKILNTSLLNTKINTPEYLLFSILGILSAYTHYFGLLYYAHLLAFLFLFNIIRKNSSEILSVVGVSILSIILYSPEIYKLLTMVEIDRVSWIEKPSISIYLIFIWGLFYFYKFSTIGLVVLLITLVIFIDYNKLKNNLNNRHFIVYCISPIAISLFFLITTSIISFYKPILTSRNLLVLIFPIFFSLSYFIIHFMRGSVSLKLIVVFLLLLKFYQGVYQDRYILNKQDYREVTKFLIETKNNNFRLFTNGHPEYFEYYASILGDRSMQFFDYKEIGATNTNEFYLIEVNNLDQIPNDEIEKLKYKYSYKFKEYNGIILHSFSPKK